MLSCRALYRRIHQEEYAISREYLHHRKRRYLQSSNCSPGDDLTFVSELFPPQPPQYTASRSHDEFPQYSFGYLADLTRCWMTCLRLSYYLADYAVQHHLQHDPEARPLWSSCKTEKEVVYSRAVGVLQSRLLCPLTNLAYFLETYAAARDAVRETGKHHHLHHSLEEQQSILQRPPFTTTEVLLSTHHCMHLLCSSVRHMMIPEFPPSSTGSWVGILLTTSTLERILDFFVAAANDQSAEAQHAHARNVQSHPQTRAQHAHTRNLSSTWTKRREFLLRMRKDWEEYLVSVGGDQTAAADHEQALVAPPDLRQVWFEAGEKEMYRRGVITHRSEDPVHILHGSYIRLHCAFCDDQY
ncbi:uncharacterized protein NFIA_069590 [Aspergillus fischeri NRRL 181]|uniref:Uncharacterized protein n=1 Tax=Neosartorya fischeri (strain ATCC 1020 / DSM 3700 / CBS 544.65 / FGSC A1164 / JCM 1740 / NRRL 181 / WB 181) TaxID=331117 RepID=A1D7U4_NEOFI|nr:uncharacterized protein NFIA_069590 [Aspergillus fischeri NRRL 181]EAW21788.1 predicted protein [Aspergillus fischeri NRRL 181]